MSVALPSDRLHPHLLSNTGPNPQQQYQRAYYAPPANTYTAPPQQQPQHAGASSSSAMPSLALYKQQPQVAPAYHLLLSTICMLQAGYLAYSCTTVDALHSRKASVPECCRLRVMPSPSILLHALC